MVCRCSAGLAAVNRQVRERITCRAADILRRRQICVAAKRPVAARGPQNHSRLQRRQVDPESAGRNRVDDFLGHDLLHRRTLDVHERRLACHGDRLGNRTDLHIAVDGDGLRSGHFDAVPFVGAEAAQCKRDFVDAGQKADDLVLAGTVGDGCSGFLDQRRARDFHRDAGKHGSRVISRHPGNRSILGTRCRRQNQQSDQGEQHEPREPTHRHDTPSVAENYCREPGVA
jgi:hypothetical protein